MALGSNIADKQQYVLQAVSKLKAYTSNVRTASMYSSKAVGYTDQPDFLNTAVEVETELSPLELLKVIKKIEFRWGPREIDIDIIFYQDEVLELQELTIPHPRYMERDFVLKPLIELDPAHKDPRSHKKLVDMLASLPVTSLSVYAKNIID
jgi:2-amino-4-hydroxy-6-hydroxymethyldihydropteridine diphosphokinase